MNVYTIKEMYGGHRRKLGENMGGALQNESDGLGDTVPQWVPGAKPRQGAGGRKLPPEAEAFL